MDLAKLPHTIVEVAQEKEHIYHMELYHHDNHYDAIMSLESGKMCNEAPNLTGKDVITVINIHFYVHLNCCVFFSSQNILLLTM